jgi:hypothetical protein
VSIVFGVGGEHIRFYHIWIGRRFLGNSGAEILPIIVTCFRSFKSDCRNLKSSLWRREVVRVSYWQAGFRLGNLCSVAV